MTLTLFKNTYGKLALFYLFITLMMFYFAFDFVMTQNKVDRFYEDFLNHADKDGTEPDCGCEETPLQEGESQVQ